VLQQALEGVEASPKGRRDLAGTAEKPQGAGWQRRDVSVATRFAVAQVFALGWLGVSVWLSLAWLRELGAAVGLVPAVLVITLVAYLPG
jgi:hypothetical protein